MAFFSRLTDIVTCNLTEILARSDNPQAALEQIVCEMEQGIAGAQRSMKSARDNEARIRGEIDEQRRQIDDWVGKAREDLAAGRDDQARQDLLRKHEIENLIAGLEMQLRAATATREHLTTTFHALEARVADARRRLTSLAAGGRVDPEAEDSAHRAAGDATIPTTATDVIDSELAALKRELQGGGSA